MRRSSVLLTFLVIAAPAKGFSQEAPSTDVVLDSWLEYATKASSITYRLKGAYRIRDAKGKVLQEGSYDILESGKRFRWEFKLPGEYHLASFDGEDWYNKGIQKDSSGKDVEQGNVLVDPVKVLEQDPRDSYVNGLVPIFPINLPQLVGQPVRTKLDQPLPKSLKQIQNDLSVTVVNEGGRKQYKLTIASSAASRSLSMPDTIWFETMDGRFVPIKVQNKPDRATAFGQIVSLSNFTTVDGIPVPLEVSNDIVWSDKSGKLQAYGGTRSILEVKLVDATKLGKQDFAATFSPNALVFREKEGFASKGADRKGNSANIAWYVGGVLILVGILLASRSLWKRRS